MSRYIEWVYMKNSAQHYYCMAKALSWTKAYIFMASDIRSVRTFFGKNLEDSHNIFRQFFIYWKLFTRRFSSCSVFSARNMRWHKL